MKTDFRFFVLVFSALLISSAIADCSEPSTDATPNFVILFSDDAGYADFGFQQNVRPEMKELTPHIDSIANAGCRFSNAYMSGSVCSPSRAGLMTGRYQQRFGHDNNIPPGYMKGGLPLTETFGAKRLQRLGYKTALIGKWHLGYPDDYHPNQRGFDWFYGCLQGARKYFPMKKVTPHKVFLDNEKPTEENGYITDRIGDGACKFIDANKADPFFLFVSFTSPHGPLEAKPEDLQSLTGIEKGTKRRKYAGLIKSLDDNVGKVLKCLNDNGLDDNTLVIFTNDNGGQTKTGANNFPLTGHKGELWEGGIRVPMAARWPGKIEAGRIIDDPVISLDFFPTFVEASGNQVDANWNWDGVSLLDLLTDEKSKLEPRTLFWRRFGKAIAAREGDWKLIKLGTEDNAKTKLFNLRDDISEKADVASGHPEVVARLSASIAEWESELGTPLWNYKRASKK